MAYEAGVSRQRVHEAKIERGGECHAQYVWRLLAARVVGRAGKRHDFAVGTGRKLVPGEKDEGEVRKMS